jgi:hypothetical protein
MPPSRPGDQGGQRAAPPFRRGVFVGVGGWCFRRRFARGTAEIGKRSQREERSSQRGRMRTRGPRSLQGRQQEDCERRAPSDRTADVPSAGVSFGERWWGLRRGCALPPTLSSRPSFHGVSDCRVSYGLSSLRRIVASGEIPSEKDGDRSVLTWWLGLPARPCALRRGSCRGKMPLPPFGGSA